MHTQLFSNETFQLLLACLALTGYGVLWTIIFKQRLHNDKPSQSTRLSFLASPVLLVHGLFLLCILLRNEGVQLGLVNVLCLIGWLTASMTVFSSVYRPTISLSLLAFPLAMLSILAAQIFPSKASPLVDMELTILSHILLSLLAFSILTIAAGQAVFIAALDYRLHHHLTRSWHLTFPPLQTLEKSLFEIISLGFLFLSLSILSGLLFLDDMFVQHVAHKTFFSIIAWLMFSILLLGRIKLGWRGNPAIKTTLAAYGFLFVAFIGSKFVLEILLQRL